MAAARELCRVRAGALPKMKGGLRALYRTLEFPGANPLKDAHAALDAAVLTTYGFNAKKDLLAQLLALNLEGKPLEFEASLLALVNAQIIPLRDEPRWKPLLSLSSSRLAGSTIYDPVQAVTVLRSLTDLINRLFSTKERTL